MSTAISIRNVSKKYVIGKQKDGSLRGTLGGMFSKKEHKTEEFWALNDVSFDIQQGDVVGIIGKNGAGKSTLLKILSQITKPTTGSIEINGRVASLLEVGTGFHPELTGRENVYLNGTILGMTRNEVKAKFDEIVAFSGVEKFIDTPVKHYSSGMYVRLAFAVAAHLEPEILIIDEVLAVGDAEFQKKCLGKMKDVASKGRTVLFVSHDLASVQKLCTKSILLNSGKIEKYADTESVIKQYVSIGNSYTKRINVPNKLFFVDEVNFVNGKISFNYDESISLLIGTQLSLSNVLKVGIAIKDISQKKIFSYVFSSEMRKGSNRFQLSIPENILMPGDYSIDVALYNEIEFDYNESCLQFVIVDKKLDLEEFRGTEVGSFIVKCKWENLQ